MIDAPADTLTIDPEFRGLIPALTADERCQLEQNVLRDGCRDPLATWRQNGRALLLDGHHRREICNEHGLPFPTVEIDLPDRAAAKEWIVRNQFGRRNLTNYQRAELALKLEPLLWARAKENLRNGGKAGGKSTAKGSQKSVKASVDTQKELAAAAGVSHDTIAKAKLISAKATEAIKEKLRRGESTINKEYKAITLATRDAERREHRRETVATLDDNTQGVHVGDFRTAGGIVADDSVDLIFTDPPYLADSIGLYGDLSRFATRVLRPGGWCLAYAGHSFLPDVLTLMREHLTYGWTFCVAHTGGDTIIRKFNLFAKWKPVVGFYKPPLSAWWSLLPDSVSGGKEKDDHPWQQAVGEAEHFISAICPANGIVVDPFCGSGTTLVAAKRLRRQWVGFEIDPATAETAVGRLAEVGMADAAEPTVTCPNCGCHEADADGDCAKCREPSIVGPTGDGPGDGDGGPEGDADA